MPSRPPSRLSWIVAASLLAAVPATAQEEVAPADTVALTDPTTATDMLPPVPLIREDPRLTWLGDTLEQAIDTLAFAEPIEVIPDSLVDPYTLARPGSRPAFEISGDALLGRGAFSLLDVLESESLFLARDLGGGGSPVFLSWAPWDPGGVQVVVDGVPSGNPLASGWDLRQIPLEGIARVAFYPGPRAGSWGGTGSGGVLAITTRRAVVRPARSLLSFGVGSFDVETFSGSFGRGLGPRGSFFVAANFDATEGLQNAGNFTRNQTVGKLAWRIGSRHVVELTRRGDELSGESGRTNLSGEEDHEAKTWHGFYRGGVGPLGLRAHGWRETHNVAQAFTLRGKAGLNGKGVRRGWSADLDLRVGGITAWLAGSDEELELDSSHPAFLSFAGISLLDPPEEFEDESLESPLTRAEWGGGLGWGEPGGRWAANAAVRRKEFGEPFESGTAWDVTGFARPGSGFELQAFAGRSVRPADPVGAAILLRRASESLEIHPGLIADPGALSTWTGWRASVIWSRPGWRASVAAFGGTGDGAFVWLPPTAWLYLDPLDTQLFSFGQEGFNTFDVLDLSAAGAEAELTMPLPYGLKGRLAYRRASLTDDRLDAQVPYVPEDQALGQLRFARRYFPSRDLLVEARLTGRYAGERATLDGDPLRSYLVVDALGQATVINFTIFVSFKNLTGLGHLTEEGFDLPGEEGYVGVVWRFRG